MAESGRGKSLSLPVVVLGAGMAAVGLIVGGALIHGLRRVNSVGSFSAAALGDAREGRTNALFRAHPALMDRLPWRPLGDFPTPVQETDLTAATTGTRLFIKRDDLASARYGGNKVRKLEFLLAEAGLDQRNTLITLGGIGSNHALAVAIHGSALGFSVDLALYHQPVTPAVRTNLGAFLAAGARLSYAGSTHRAFIQAAELFRRRRAQGLRPFFIMVGGSSRLGCVGYVNAAFELAEQVRAGLLPEPDVIFVPLGTCGTAAGLIAGLKAAGLNSRVAAVRVADPFPANAMVLRAMAQDVLDYLHALDRTVPARRIESREFEVFTGYLGDGYGYPTAEGEAAVAVGAPLLQLETTYTGKSFAACLAFCRARDRGTNVLFWNTYNSAPIPAPHSLVGLPADLASILRPNHLVPQPVPRLP